MNQLNIRLTDRHMQMLVELADEFGSKSSAFRVAIEKLYEQVIRPESDEVRQALADYGFSLEALKR